MPSLRNGRLAGRFVEVVTVFALVLVAAMSVAGVIALRGGTDLRCAAGAISAPAVSCASSSHDAGTAPAPLVRVVFEPDRSAPAPGR